MERDHTETWVAAAQQGDSLALAKLLATYYPRLRARAEAGMDAAMRVRSAPDDILQEVYLHVFRHISQFQDRGPKSFLNWVFTILDHQLVDARRAAHRQMRDVAREVTAVGAARLDSYWNLFDQLRADSGTPSRIVRRDEALGALLACISDLSETHRQVIQLRFLEGLPVAEVAARLNKTESAVVALSQRALKALRASMDHLGEFSFGG